MNGTQQAGNTITKNSRINADVERVISLVNTVNNAHQRIECHTSALGYFNECPRATGSASVSPIPNNLQTAIADLERAVDMLHGALNLFD